MNNLTIVIPTFNNIKGLTYLLKYFKDKPYTIIIVDNGKLIQNFRIKFLDIYNQKIKNKFKKFIFLPQEKNLGFAKAVNLGAKLVKTPWFLILNDDIRFRIQKSKIKTKNNNKKLTIKKYKNPIAFLFQYIRRNNLEAVTPILKNPDGKIENVGYKILPEGKIKLIQTFNTKSETFASDQIDGITAACLLIKTAAFRKLGGFDESFFAYLEDVEFFLRFKKNGFKFAIAPVEVIHEHMATTKTLGLFKARQDLINWWRLYFKHSSKFKTNLNFFIERIRNLFGYLKAVINNK